MAHRLQLVSEKAANSVPYVVKYISVVNQFAKSLKFSPKFQRILEDSEELHGTKARKIKQIFFTRWLSIVDSVQALAGNLGAVISALQVAASERETSGRVVLHGVAQQMATVKFILMTHFLADAVGVSGLLSLVLQKENVTYMGAKAQVDAAIVAIQSMLTTPGPYTKEILDAIPSVADPSGYVSYQGHDIKDKKGYREAFENASKAYVHEVVSRLSIAFPDTAVMEDFLPLSPKECKHLTPENASKKIISLCDRYDNVVNKDEVMVEWMLLSRTLKQPIYEHFDVKDCLKHILHPNKEAYPNFVKLAAICAVLPVTSVNCERGTSGYNAIQSDA